jgi:hypothetical protein
VSQANQQQNVIPAIIDTASLFSAGSLIDQVAPFTALAVRDWLRNLRTAVDRCDRDEVVLAQRMLTGFVKNLRVMGFESAADALAVDVGKMVGEHFASGVSGGGYGLDWKSNGDCG